MARIEKGFVMPTISHAGGTVSLDVELDKFAEKVTGIALEADPETLLHQRGWFEATLNNTQIHQGDFHARRYMNGMDLQPDGRFKTVDLEAGNGIFRATVRDRDLSGFPFKPYTVTLYLRIELAE